MKKGSGMNLVGQVFGKLTVEVLDHIKRGNYFWLCRCECGNTCIKNTSHLKRTNFREGTEFNCGCFNNLIKHGHCKDRVNSTTYGVWKAMVQRCTNSKNTQYSDYGGRDIKVCPEWIKSFENFLADMGEKPEGLSLDRINNNGNYCKSNCRWATYAEQARNKRTNRLITYKDETKCLEDWSISFGIDVGTLTHRLKINWPLDLVFSLKKYQRYKPC